MLKPIATLRGRPQLVIWTSANASHSISIVACALYLVSVCICGELSIFARVGLRCRKDPDPSAAADRRWVTLLPVRSHWQVEPGRGGSCAPSSPACPHVLPFTLSPLAPPPPLSDSLPAVLPPGMQTPTTTGNCHHLSTIWLLPVESDHREGACNKWRKLDPATSLDTVPSSGHGQ